MTDQEAAPAGNGGERSGKPDPLDEAREAAMMRKVLRMQQQHREGGVDPELAQEDEAPETGS